MVSKLQLENMVLVDAILFRRHSDCITEQWQTGQWTVVLATYRAGKHKVTRNISSQRNGAHGYLIIWTILQQVRKVLWTRKAPASLLTLLYAYGNPRLCKKYSSLRSTTHRAAAGRCGVSEGSSSFKSIT